MIVDLHSHVIPRRAIDAIRAAPAEFAARIETRDGVEKVFHDQGYVYPLLAAFYDPAAKLAAMDQRRIDISVVSPAPPMFYYWADASLAIRVATLVNDGIAEFVASNPKRLRGMGTLPMGHPDEAIAELERIVRLYDFRCVELGTSIEGTLLSEPRYRAVLRRCEELGVFVFAHPYYVGDKCGMEGFYLTNLLGNPWDTTLMATNLMLDGALEQMPRLNICLAHGGGFLPYQLGRLAHGHKVRTETRSKTSTSPFDLARRFHYDTMVFTPQALRYLVGMVGADRVCLGTDDPFDMSEADPVGLVQSANGLSESECEHICGHNALRLLREIS